MSEHLDNLTVPAHQARSARPKAGAAPRRATIAAVTAALALGNLLGAGPADAHTVLTPAPVPGTMPVDVVVAQMFNGGCQDMAVAENATNKVVILEDAGVCDGGYVPIGSYTVGANPRGLAVGKLDSGGTVDIAVAAADSDQVWVLKGNGTGGFTPTAAISLPAGSHPRQVVVGRWDSDSRDDLAVTNGNANSLSVYRQVGGAQTWVQTTPIPFAGGSQPHAMTVADLNGDSDLDLVTANYTAGEVSVLLGVPGAGNPGAMFGSPTQFTAGPLPAAIVAGDFDTDGCVDVVAANRSATNATVGFMKGNCSGGLMAPVTSNATGTTANTGRFINGLGAGNLLGNSKIDLVVTYRDSSFNGWAAELTGTGTGTFSWSAAHELPAGSNPYGVAVGQFIPGGFRDYAIASQGTSSVRVHQG